MLGLDQVVSDESEIAAFAVVSAIGLGFSPGMTGPA